MVPPVSSISSTAVSLSDEGIEMEHHAVPTTPKQKTLRKHRTARKEGDSAQQLDDDDDEDDEDSGHEEGQDDDTEEAKRPSLFFISVP